MDSYGSLHNASVTRNALRQEASKIDPFLTMRYNTGLAAVADPGHILFLRIYILSYITAKIVI
jgi:hypothetical protein